MHTPAPWRIGFSDSSGINEGIYITTASDGVVVRGGSPEGDLMFGVLRVEDAHLIAAAPDLLEALQIAWLWIDNWEPEFVSDEEWTEVAGPLIRAALAKATGEQP